MSDLYDKLYEDLKACALSAIPVDPDDGTTFIKIDGVTPIWGSPDIVAAAVASAMYTVVGIRLDDARAEGVTAGRTTGPCCQDAGDSDGNAHAEDCRYLAGVLFGRKQAAADALRAAAADAREQPFGPPEYWQRHQKLGVARWLEQRATELADRDVTEGATSA